MTGRAGEEDDVTRRLAAGAFAAIGLAAAPAAAGKADVLAAAVRCDAAHRCDFEATVRHADEGWSHYADLWVVEDEDGRVLGRRVLRHPHVREQPFTRRLRGVAVPEDVERVRVRARDHRHGFGGRAVTLALPDGAGRARSEEAAAAGPPADAPSGPAPADAGAGP